MTHSWLAYLPPHLASYLLAHPNTSPIDLVMHQQVVALFADISGFTPMSEALGQVGPSGTEELSWILNHTFGAMIDIIHSYDGSIGKFAGDALTVIFPFPPTSTEDPTASPNTGEPVRRAIQCALDMQQAMSELRAMATSAGTFQLTMKIGLGMGTLLSTTVGEESIRLEYLLAGSALDRCAEAEQHASQGTIVVDDDLLGLIQAYDAQPVASGFSQITHLQRYPRQIHSPRQTMPDPHAVAIIARYLPPAIAERLTHDQQGLVDEHRTTTTMFVRFDGFDYQEPTALGLLQSYLRTVVQISDSYGGYLRQVDVGDKGSLYIVLFGAPLAHEDDAERALLCALDLRSAANQLNIPTATGITTGRIFCGLVGSNLRREYAAIGDSVNLAARLMTAAQPGQILVDSPTRRATRASFHWKELEPLTVKGKRAPVSVAALERRQQHRTTRLRAPSYRLPMVGRQTELQLCLTLVEQTCRGQGQIIGISGEAGMGKTRLVAELLRSLTPRPVTYFISECLSYGITSSYLVWQRLLRGLLGLTPDLPDDIQCERIHSQLHALDPQFLERMPLMGDALQLPIPETDFTRTLNPEQRKQALHALLISCLRAWAKQHPLLLVLEDCHWIDPLSDELLFMLAQRIANVPLLLLITYRPLSTERIDTTAPVLALRTLPRYHEVTLTTFSRKETQELIGLKLALLFGDTTQIPAMLVDRVVERAQGTPFYIDELLNLLHDRDIDVHNPDALMHIELPDSVQRLILSRIDRLEEVPKTILKRASILGRLFKASWVWQLAPELGESTVVRAQLKHLQQLDFTQQERSEPEMEYLFKHLITRDVAYESLSYATRAQLHEQVGAFIEQTYSHELEHWLDVLAHHYGNSTNRDKQRKYFRMAGDAARQVFANAAAIHYYLRLLDLLLSEEQGEVLVILSDIERHSNLHSAEEHARAAMAMAEQQGDAGLYANAAIPLGWVLRYTGRMEQAINLLEPLRQQLSIQGPSRTLTGVLNQLASIMYYQGQLDQLASIQADLLHCATVIDDHISICEAINYKGIEHHARGQYREALTNFEMGLQLAMTHNLQQQTTYLLGNMGVVYSELGVYEQALLFDQRDLDLALRIGYQEEVARCIWHMGSVYRKLGMVSEASACLQASFILLGEPPGIYWVVLGLNELIWLSVQSGRMDEAERIFDRAIVLGKTFQRVLVNLWHTRATFLTQQGRYAEAQRALAEALTLHPPSNNSRVSLQLQLLALRLESALGQREPGNALTELERLRDTWTNGADQAMLSYTIWKIDPSGQHARQRAAEQYRSLYLESPNVEYRQRYRELTGEDLPDPPPFPPLPPIVQEYQLDMDELLHRVDQLAEELPPPS